MYIIDTDPGLDDAHALAMACRMLPPEQLVITTVAGNVGLGAVTENAAWLLEQWAPEVALYAGAALPLSGAPVDAAHIHGDDGLAGFPRERATRRPHSEHAAVAIAKLARQHPGTLRIIALGPLTNLALALALEPGLPDLVADLTIMGGSPAQHGNASLNAEFNIFADPVAAEVVFARMRHITLLTWDASLAHRFSRAELEGFWAGDSAPARTLRALHEHRISNDPGYAANTDFGRPDPLAMAAALAPGCIASAREHRVRVVHDGGLAHGVTVVDERDATSDRAPVRLIDAFHADALRAALTV
ncbi:nucleoside hydrolase [Microbacterium sp. CIAB417]|uniref:nucleoside hydrolase n=1 Tax=Microbacterium sp. CIAB417 TaxID=2860287 RepID=UPI001FADADCB|nr:nucleoside hydrolase [Microbacterium sp. CIAB417]